METSRDPIRLGFKNAESLIFEDDSAWRRMPEMRRFRDQWAVSRLSPSLRPTGRAAILDFLDSAGPEQEAALSEHFGRAVTIDKVDRNSVLNIEFEADCPPDLEDMSRYSGFGSFLKGNRLYLTFWR